MKTFLTLFCFLTFMSNGFAQTESTVVVHKDPRIDILLKKQAEANDLSTRNSAKRRTARGYRLLVVSSNNRAEAIAARTKILTNFPELKARMEYRAPYYRVKAGDFISRNDAQAYQKRMASMFPGSIFIMSDVIEVKPEEADKLNDKN
ncbi:MAG TPA: SPOR domain-containing protein [Niabella sp.]|nr:SPOR domain-containing protein [Niabella sp.]HOZ96285.1 SPOR domain-containing protein [Niabella sp.]HQW14641.1 SPOR domain-containing protein [Niabella sp.]HQX19780.1 SPOR domain-containing protein [Niabella sp.]HQX41120.1 SPOR domain-containing protein [Niabella sp.]